MPRFIDAHDGSKKQTEENKHEHKQHEFNRRSTEINMYSRTNKGQTLYFRFEEQIEECKQT